MRIVNENVDVKSIYTLEELNSLYKSNSVIAGTFVKYNPDEGLILDLGNDIVGKMKFNDFEDSDNISINSVIAKVGHVVCGFIDKIENDVVYLNRAKLQKYYKSTYLANLEYGTVFDTTVISIAPFGAFVDMGYGILGLLPIGNVSIARFSAIKDVLKPGMNIKVIYQGEISTGYVVSHKELLGTWEENLSDFKIGEFCQGIVRELKSYGAFIEIAPNLTGLADFPENVSIHTGDSVCVILKSVNPEKLKVKLQIVSVSDAPYKVKYKYRIKDGVLKNWEYTPKNSLKHISSTFEGKIK